jgi:ATP-dependent DNA helicase RecG
MACALLFAKDPATAIPGAVIRFQRYEGTEKLTGAERNVVKDEWIDGRVPDAIVKANSIVQSQVRTFSRLGRGGKFVTAPEYPQPAWYEAIVNACVHRSYSLRNMNIFIKMFDDRLVIESPGPFLPFVTPENIYDVHHRRNYFLMDAMFYMDFVKCENEGTRRMRDVMIASDLPAPEFEQKQIGNAFVRVTLRNNQSLRHEWIDKDATDIVGEAMDRLLSVKERRCINFVADHGKINVSEAQRLLSEKTWHAGRTVLQGLVEKGIFEYVSKYERDPNAHYRLKPLSGTPPGKST